MWAVYALLSALFASFTAITAKTGVANINSNLATGIRTIIVLVMIWLIIWARSEHRGLAALSRYNWFFLVLSGICTGLSWIFYFKALKEGNISQVALLDKLSVEFTLVLAAVFLQEKLDLKTMLAASLIVGGTVLLLYK